MAPIMSKTQLIKRGSCCGGGCQECPYFPKHTKAATELFQMPTSEDLRCRPVCSINTMQKGDCICYLDKIS